MFDRSTTARRPLVGTASVLLLLLATGCSTAHTSTAAQPRPVAPSPSGSAAPTPTSVPSPSSADIDKLVADLPPAPSDSKHFDDGQPLGALTLDQFVSSFFSPTAQASAHATESARGLQFAARRNWMSVSSAFVDTYLIRFSTPKGAESFYDARLAEDASKYDAGGSSSVPQIPNNKIFVKTGLDKYGNALARIFVQAGNTVITVYTASPATPDKDTVSALALQAYHAVSAQQGAAGSS
ncbi:hypothetical protein P3T37_003345 [Kitasatospora sp. MAA4]|uniref:hypothetical protein n=1 Tax=Kitasatospora sp. MAA4 TaxID=3035093 RepID=UPI002475D90A|nr:hypothetical protein [Kitasatospora sp. MAA4]MDH6133946.1 hypothetical protein [Kitasatospora sp. MAA4]